MKVLVVACVCSCLSGCFLVSTEKRNPRTELSAELDSQFNHRGMPNVDDDVLRADYRTTVPASWSNEENAASWRVGTTGWMALHDDIGDSWFPGGHSGEFVEVDLSVDYSHTIGRFDFVAGLVDYVIMNGQEFITNSPAFSERGETKELFASAAFDLWRGFTPFAEGHWDVDEVSGGFYGELGMKKGFAMGEKFGANARLAAGYSNEAHAAWTWGETPRFDSGFAVVLGEVVFDYAYDPETSVFVRVGGSTFIDDDQEDWFDTIDVESDNVWIGLGLAWSH